MAATQFDHTIRLYRIIYKIAELGDEVASKILKGNKCKEEQTALNLLVALLDVLKNYNPGSYKAIASFRLQKQTNDLLLVPQQVTIYAGNTPVLVMGPTTFLPSSDINTNILYLANLINTTSSSFTAEGLGDKLFISSKTAGDYLNGTPLYVVTNPEYLITLDERDFNYGQDAVPAADNCLTQTEVDNLFLFIEKKYCIDFGVYGQTTPETIEDPSVTPTPESAYLLLEDGYYMLQEDGFKIKLEISGSQTSY